MSDGKPSFWHTLPGMMTGVASLLTAVVAAGTFFFGKGESKEQPAAAPGANATFKLRNLSSCQEITGTWDWFVGGTVRIDKGGRIEWRKDGGNTPPTVIGSWVCADTKPRKYLLNWQAGVTETIALSPDKKSVSGVNSLGVQVSGTRQ